MFDDKMSRDKVIQRPGQMEPSTANPPDEKIVINGKLNNRVQRLLPLLQHYIQLLRLPYCPAENWVFSWKMNSVLT